MYFCLTDEVERWHVEAQASTSHFLRDTIYQIKKFYNDRDLRLRGI